MTVCYTPFAPLVLKRARCGERSYKTGGETPPLRRVSEPGLAGFQDLQDKRRGVGEVYTCMHVYRCTRTHLEKRSQIMILYAKCLSKEIKNGKDMTNELYFSICALST